MKLRSFAHLPSWCLGTLALCSFAAILFTGCARLRPGMKPEMPAEAKPGIEIHTQYAVSSNPRRSYNTFEVYIANNTTSPIEFTGAELDGRFLPKVQPAQLQKLLAVKLAEGEEISVADPGFPEDSYITWWQYYPCNEVKPGEAIEFQVNLKAHNLPRQELHLLHRKVGTATQSDETIVVPAPRFREPAKRLTAITYSQDGKRVFVQYSSRKVGIKRLLVNGKTISEFKMLQSSFVDTPDMLAFDAPSAFKTGDALHVRAEFQDGVWRDAFVRVLLGIALDGGFSDEKNEQSIRKEYGLDEASIVEMLPFDVACSDMRSAHKGISAPALTGARAEVFAKRANHLAAVNYCAAYYPELGDIYGQATDAVYAKPYQLGWGKQPARFIEAEERRALEEAQSAQPRPWLWVPDRYNRSGRYMASGELEVLSWLMLERGSKGIRYHYWNSPVAEIMAEHPWLLSGLEKLNKDIASQKEILAPLVWVNEWNVEKEKVKVYESWSGDQGILLMVRNLDYRTEMPESKGQEPHFKVVPKQNVNIPVHLPVWFKGKKAKDLLSGNSLPAERQEDEMQFKLDRLEAFRLIWLE